MRLTRISYAIAHSGSAEFVKKLSEADAEDKEEQLKLIGQFGVGFYSVFMVADRVVVTTRSADPKAEAVMWESTGDGAYTLAKADKETRGTEIKIYVRSDCEEFLDAHRLEGIIRKHSDFVSIRSRSRVSRPIIPLPSGRVRAMRLPTSST